jgi:hypothetical protein
MAIKTSKSSESYFSQYKTMKKYAKNRLKKLERQLKLQPENAAQINAAMSRVSDYRRKKPSTRKWTKTAIREAMIKTLFSKVNANPAQTAGHGFRVVWST